MAPKPDPDQPIAPTTGNPAVIDPLTNKPSNFASLQDGPATDTGVAAPALTAPVQGPPLPGEHLGTAVAGSLENVNSWETTEIGHLAGTANAGTAGSIAAEWAQLGAGFEGLTDDLDKALSAAVAEAWRGPGGDAALGAVKAFIQGAQNTTLDFHTMWTTMTGAGEAAGAFNSALIGMAVENVFLTPAQQAAQVGPARTAMSAHYVSANQTTDGKIPSFTQPVLPAGGIPATFSDDGSGSGAGAGNGSGQGGGTQSPGGQAPGDNGKPGTDDGRQQQQPQQPNSSANGTTAGTQGNSAGSNAGAQNAGAGDGSGGVGPTADQTKAAGFDPSAAGGGGFGGGGGGGGIGGGADSGPLAEPTLGGGAAQGAGGPAAGAVIGRPAAGSGASGMPGMSGAKGAGGKDKEHRTAAYLYGRRNGEVLVGDDRLVGPDVIGADLVAPQPDTPMAGEDSEWVERA